MNFSTLITSDSKCLDLLGSRLVYEVGTMDAQTAVAGVKTIQGALNILAALNLTTYISPPQAVVQDGDIFDFIVVGSGSAGSVIASRLSEVKEFNVLLIEAGGDPPFESEVPGLLSFLKRSKVDWNYTSVNDGYTQQYHKNHTFDLTRGKMLGGSSSLNYMAYTRGNYHDYDTWAAITNDSTWNWDNVLPYFIKSERLDDHVISNSPDALFHGTDGYLGVTRQHSKVLIKYFKAFAEAGNDIVRDTNGYHPLGYSESFFTIADGVRQSSCYSFLTPVKCRENLNILKNTLVSKILFDEYNNAVGVEAISEYGETVTFKASREVIVSAGAFDSPKLLMLSGVGPKHHLKSKNIEVIADLPVGQTLQDHHFVTLVHKMGKAAPPTSSNPHEFPLPLMIGYAALDKTIQGYPDYQTLNLIMNDPDVLLNFCSFYYTYNDKICNEIYRESNGREVLFSLNSHLYPQSRGKVLLRSSNPKDDPLIYTGYYSNDTDMEKHINYIEDFLRVQSTTYFRSVNAELIVPKDCGCNEMSKREFWRCYILCMMASGYHFSGSCPMGSVVDSRLRVIGVQKLRVADASIMPTIAGANTNAPTIMIGEKVSDMIKEDHCVEY